MGAAADKLGLTEINIDTWAKEWLNSAGCSEIGIDFQSNEGLITSFIVKQELYGDHELNRLRTQKF